MEERGKIRGRQEIPVEDTWAVEDLFPSDQAWEEEFARFQEDCAKPIPYAGHLADSPRQLVRCLEEMEKAYVRMDRLGSYCMRKRDVDTRGPVYLSMAGRFSGASVRLSAAYSFFTSELMGISDEKLEEFYRAEPKLERFRRFLTDERRMREHTLSPTEEKLLASSGDMSGAPQDIFGAFFNADLTFPKVTDSQGNSYPLSNGTFVLWEESRDRTLRRNAYETYYDVLGGFQNTAAAMLNAQMKKLQFYADARKFDSALEASLMSHDVPVSVYDNLIEAVHQNIDKMHRYVRLRKKLLGVDEMRFYDVYAGCGTQEEAYIPFAQAKETVYRALAPLGEDYRRILREGFENRWIDVYENEGKRSGAYSAGSLVHPYVLLNYTGTLDSQFTLAHEMGHALHSYLSGKNQEYLDSQYVIFVAEVASTCNEALLMEYLLGKTQDKAERIRLLNYFMEQFKGTLYRQTMFAEFERTVGQMVQRGETLTAQALCQEYRRLNRFYFGPDMVVDDRIALEWARIPHFYYNYYVFQYATGYSAAIALSRRILREGESAVKDYLGFLSGGCSKSPIELLRGAGVDMTSPEPVNQALSLFGEILDEMEALTEG